MIPARWISIRIGCPSKVMWCRQYYPKAYATRHVWSPSFLYFQQNPKSIEIALLFVSVLYWYTCTNFIRRTFVKGYYSTLHFKHTQFKSYNNARQTRYRAFFFHQSFIRIQHGPTRFIHCSRRLRSLRKVDTMRKPCKQTPTGWPSYRVGQVSW